MADSIADLGDSTDIFILKPDWTDLPKVSLSSGREVLQYNQARVSLRPLSTFTGRTIEYGFSVFDKEDEYYILNFYQTQRGRKKRFWVPLWHQEFQLAEAIVNGSYQFKINDSDFVDIVKYYERIYIYTAAGDLITRKVLSKIDDVTYIVQTAFDRNIALADVLFFGRIILCRFEQDEVEMQHETDSVSSCSIAFKELPKEYDHGKSVV